MPPVDCNCASYPGVRQAESKIAKDPARAVGPADLADCYLAHTVGIGVPLCGDSQATTVPAYGPLVSSSRPMERIEVSALDLEPKSSTAPSGSIIHDFANQGSAI